MVKHTYLYALTLTLLTPAAGLAQGNYANTVLSHNPVAYWRLNETSLGSAVDASAVGGLQNGTYINFGAGVGAGNIGQAGPRPTTFIGGQPLLGFEANNFAPHFAGIQAVATNRTRVEVPDSAAISITGALTLEAWVNPTSLGGTANNNGIVAKYIGNPTADRSYQLFVNSQTPGGVGGPGLAVSQNGTFTAGLSNQIVDATPLATNNWQHVVATFQPDQAMRLYVNGVLVEELLGTAIIDSVFDSTSPLWIGSTFNLSDANTFFGGLIDEVAVYNYALDDVNGDGVIDANNRVVQHFNAAFVALAVPEPHSILLWCGLAVGAIGVGLCRRKHQA